MTFILIVWFSEDN